MCAVQIVQGIKRSYISHVRVSEVLMKYICNHFTHTHTRTHGHTHADSHARTHAYTRKRKEKANKQTGRHKDLTVTGRYRCVTPALVNV